MRYFWFLHVDRDRFKKDPWYRLAVRFMAVNIFSGFLLFAVAFADAVDKIILLIKFLFL